MPTSTAPRRVEHGQRLGGQARVEQEVVDDAAPADQGDPGVGPHQRGGPQRHQHAGGGEFGPDPARPGHQRGDGIAEQQGGGGAGDGDPERAQHHLQEERLGHQALIVVQAWRRRGHAGQQEAQDRQEERPAQQQASGAISARVSESPSWPRNAVLRPRSGTADGAASSASSLMRCRRRRSPPRPARSPPPRRRVRRLPARTGCPWLRAAPRRRAARPAWQRLAPLNTSCARRPRRPGSVSTVAGGERHVLGAHRQPRRSTRRRAAPGRSRGRCRRRATRGIARPDTALHDAGQQVHLADEIRHERIGRLVVQRARRAELDEAAVIHDGHLVRHGQRLLLVMRDVDHGGAEAALQLLQLDLHVLAQLLVQRAERLVHQDHRRLEHDRPGQRHALLLPAGQLGRLARGVAVELHHGQRAADLFVPLGPADAAGAQRKGDVLGHRHVRKQRVALEHHRDAALVRRHAGEVALAHHEPAGIRLLEPGQHHQQRRLAGTGRAQQRDERARRDLQRDAGDRRHRAIAAPHAVDVDRQTAARHRPTALHHHAPDASRCILGEPVALAICSGYHSNFNPRC